MRNLFYSPRAKTWDGLRGLVFVFAAIFLGILAYLVIGEHMLDQEGRLLLLIPAIAGAACLACAFTVSDRHLQKIYTWLCF
jgi:hypothetical protein